MENQNLNQTEEKRIDLKVRVSRDGKWIIMNVPGIEQAIIKSVNYFRKILENADNRERNAAVNIENIK